MSDAPTIKEAREAKGLRQRDLASAADVSIATISACETGHCWPRSAYTRRKIAKALGINPATLTTPERKRA